MTEKKVIYINSLPEFRDTGTSNEDFTITKKNQEFVGVPVSAKLVSACIPYTWDNITEENNMFIFAESGASPETIAIPVGNYSGKQIAEFIEAKLNELSSQDYTVIFDIQTLKFTFSTTGISGFQFDFPADSAHEILGFNQEISPATFQTSFESVNKMILLKDYEILICSDIVRGSDNGIIPWNINLIPDTNSQHQIMARVPINAYFASVITYSASDSLPEFLLTQSKFAKARSATDSTTPSIRFFLKFPSGKPVNLNGYHWTAELVLNFK